MAKNRILIIGMVVALCVIIVIALSYIVLVQQNEEPYLSQETGKTWVETDPIQCLGNPWQVDWLKSHGNDYGAYPRGNPSAGLSEEEVEIIKDYYQRQGVTIYDVKWKIWDELVCEACSCPEGYTLYLLVADSDVGIMLNFGYTISE